MAPRRTPTTVDELDLFTAALDEFLRATRRAKGRLSVSDEAGGELSLSQYHLLDPLERCDGGLTLGDLADRAGVAAPTASRMIDGMVRDALVARERATDDRRRVDLRITADGRRRVESKRARITQRRAQVFASLTEAERREAPRILASLADAMDELR